MNHPPKYPSTPHWPWSQTVHKDDRYHQDPIAFVGREVVITEKLDGGNIQRIIDSGNIGAMKVKLADNRVNRSGDKSKMDPRRAEKLNTRYDMSIEMLEAVLTERLGCA